MDSAFSSQASPVFIHAVQEGARVSARILKMSWIHDKSPVSITGYAPFKTDSGPISIICLELFLELLREINILDTDIYAVVYHNSVRRQFQDRSLTDCLQLAFQFIKKSYDGGYSTLPGLFLTSYLAFTVILNTLLLSSLFDSRHSKTRSHSSSPPLPAVLVFSNGQSSL